jgi:hypothetical protein
MARPTGSLALDALGVMLLGLNFVEQFAEYI